MNKTFSSQNKRINGGNGTTVLPSLAIDKFIDSSVQEWSLNSKGYPTVVRGNSRVSSNGMVPPHPVPQTSSRMGHQHFQFTPMKNTAEKRVYRTIDADEPQITPKPQSSSSHNPYQQSFRPPLKQLEQNQDLGFRADEQYFKQSQAHGVGVIAQSVKNQPSQRYRALSLNGVMSKPDAQQVSKHNNLLPPTPLGIKTKKETQKVTQYNDIRAIQFLGAYGDHKIGEVKITNEELKEFLKRLGNPESYDGRIMFKHFMDHFREWIKRMAKIASELREKLYLHDFSGQTDFSQIVMDCSRHCGDISEVIESARCVQERYSQNQSLEKVVSQLWKRQECFRELKESCEVLTTVQAELEGVVLACEGNDKVEEIIRKGKQKAENKQGLNRHLDRMQGEFEIFQELLQEFEAAKGMNIWDLMKIAERLQRARDESIFLPFQAKERLEQNLQTITILIKQAEDNSKENSLKYLRELINQVRKRMQLNLHKEEFDEQVKGIRDILSKLRKEIVFERESEGISKAEIILNRIDSIFTTLIAVLKSEQCFSKGEVVIINHNCREAVKHAADYSQQFSQNTRALVQLFRFLKQHLESNSSTFEITKNQLAKPSMIECESDVFLNNEGTTTQSSSFYHPHTSVTTSIPQSVHNLNKGKGESDCDSVNNDMPSSNSYSLSQYEPNETVPQQSQISRHAYVPAILNKRNKNRVITLRRYVGEGERSNSEMDSTRHTKVGLLNRQCKFLEILVEQCQEQEKQEIELGIGCNPFKKLLSTYENQGEDRNELMHRVQTDSRVLADWIRKSESLNMEGSLSEEIQELFGNYLKKVTLWHAIPQEIDAAKKLKEMLNFCEEKSEVVYLILQESIQNNMLQRQMGQDGLRECIARVARLAIEKSISILKLIAVEESLQSAVARIIEGANQLSISHLPYILAADCNAAQQLLPFIKDYQNSFSQLLSKYRQMLLKTTAYNYLLGESSVISPNFASVQQPISQLLHLVYSSNSSNANESAAFILAEFAGKLKDIFITAKRNLDESHQNIPEYLQPNSIDPQQMTAAQAVKLLDPKVKQIFQRKVDRVIEGCTIKAVKSENIPDSFPYSQRQKMILSILRRLGEYFEAKNENVILLQDTHHKIVFICKHNQRDFTHPLDRFQSTQKPSIITEQIKNYPEIYKQIVLNSVFFHSITQNQSLHKQQLDSITYDPRQNQREGTQILCTSKGSFFLSDHAENKPVLDILARCSCKLTVRGNNSALRESKLFELPFPSEVTQIRMPMQLEDIAQVNISLFCETHQQVVMSSTATVLSFLNSLFQFPSDILKQSAILHLQSLQNNSYSSQIEALSQLIQPSQPPEEPPTQYSFPQLPNSVSRRLNTLNPMLAQPQETMFAYRSSLNAIEEESYCLTQLSMTKNNPYQSPSEKQGNTLLCQESAYLGYQPYNDQEENEHKEEHEDNRQHKTLNNSNNNNDNDDGLLSDHMSENEEQEILGEMNQIHRQWDGLFANDSKIDDVDKQYKERNSFGQSQGKQNKSHLNQKKKIKSFRCVVEELKHAVFEI